MVLEKTLESPQTAGRWNQSILKEIYPEYWLQGLMLKLQLQYFGHLLWRASSLEKILMLGKIEGKRRRRWQRMRWLDCIIISMDISLSKFQEILENMEAWRAAVHGVTKSQTWLSYWTTPAKLTFCLTWILQWLLKHSAHIHAGILPICSPLHISGKV